MKTISNEPMVKHSNQVHTTTDYFLFKSISGNRQFNELHYKRLKASMLEQYLFTVILVNENYEIIDGQHRFKVIQELGLPLNYVICKGYALPEVHRLNANSKTWNSDDYLDGYCNMGKKDYLIYRDFKEKYGFGHNECMGMLTGKNSVGTSLNEFYNGTFKVTDYEEACRRAELICTLEPFYAGYKRRAFIGALLNLFSKPQFEFTEFIAKLSKNQSALVDCATSAQYISLIEEIYNYRRQIKVNLRY